MRKIFDSALAAIERRLACRRSEWVKFLGEVIQRLENEAATLRTELESQADGFAAHILEADHQLSGQRVQYERQLAELRQHHADAIAALERERASAQHDHEDAMESADEQLADAEGRYAALERELADTKQALDLNAKKLEVAEDQNETLWEVIERDRYRVQAERAAYQRATAEAESATGRAGVEVIEEE